MGRLGWAGHFHCETGILGRLPSTRPVEAAYTRASDILRQTEALLGELS